MKVTIQHTVELNEIPLRINEMVDNSVKQLDTISKVATTLDSINPEKFLDQVDFLRRKLFAIDNNLEECASLMKGYQKASTTSNPTPAQPESVPGNGMSPEIYEKTLQKMEQVSKMMENAAPGTPNE
jgi:hypothetical protein